MSTLMLKKNLLCFYVTKFILIVFLSEMYISRILKVNMGKYLTGQDEFFQ